MSCEEDERRVRAARRRDDDRLACVVDALERRREEPAYVGGELLLDARLGRDVHDLEQPLGEALAIRCGGVPGHGAEPTAPPRPAGTESAQFRRKSIASVLSGVTGDPMGAIEGGTCKQPPDATSANADGRNALSRGIIKGVSGRQPDPAP